MVNKDKKYEIDDSRAPIVKKIFEMYANGYLMTDIIKYLNEKQIKTSQGNEFNKSSIGNILKNKKYIGIYSYNGFETKDGVPRIIDDETFYKVQEIMQKNKRAPARAKSNVEYLLTTKLFCGTCKEMMVGICGTSYNGSVHNYYSCNGKRKHKCKRKNVRKDVIENLVLKYARDVLTDKNISKIAKATMKKIEDEQKNSVLIYLKKEFKDKKQQQSNLLESLKICEIDSVRKSIFGEIEKIDNELKELEVSILTEESKNVELTESQIISFLKEIRNGNINDIKYQKVLINVLIDKVYLYDDNITIIVNTDKKRDSRIVIPSIEKIESSFLEECGQPNKTNTNFYYFVGGFAVKIKL